MSDNNAMYDLAVPTGDHGCCPVCGKPFAEADDPLFAVAGQVARWLNGPQLPASGAAGREPDATPREPFGKPGA